MRSPSFSGRWEDCRPPPEDNILLLLLGGLNAAQKLFLTKFRIPYITKRHMIHRTKTAAFTRILLLALLSFSSLSPFLLLLLHLVVVLPPPRVTAAAAPHLVPLLCASSSWVFVWIVAFLPSSTTISYYQVVVSAWYAICIPFFPVPRQSRP
jgi:hypothetical protein